MIELEVRSAPSIGREAFLADHPPFSIALDGYVHCEPFLAIQPNGPYRNFNHHEVVDRSCTASTCEQARRAVLLGLYDLFRERSGRRAVLWVNDCDQDVCLSTWILMNPDRAAEPLVRVLAGIGDLLDMSAGTFPMPHDRERLGEIRWVFEPYVRARPRLMMMNAGDMRTVIDHVHLRIEQFAMGHAQELPLEGEYRRIGGDEWWMVEVDHMTARERMVVAGVRAAVELTAKHGDHYAYTVWRRSEYITWFPVRAILDALTVEEGDGRKWGGADNVGGSPRPGGSRLTPKEVEAVVARVVAAHR